MSQDANTQSQNANSAPTGGEGSAPENKAPESTPADRPNNADSVDYKSLYDQEVERRQKAENKIEKMKRKGKESDGEGAPDLEEYRSIAREEAQRAATKASFDTMLDRVSSNPDERKLIELHLDNVVPSGDLMTDIRRAKLLANEHKYANLQKEVHASNQSKQSTDTSAPTGAAKPQTEVPKSPEVNQFAEKYAQKLPPRYRKGMKND